MFTHTASALTDVLLNDPTTTSSYMVSLRYDDSKGILLPEAGFSSPYHIIRGPFIPDPRGLESGLLGILVGPGEKVYQRFGIAKPKVSVTGTIMSFAVSAPYHPSAERLDLYKGATRLFSIDLSASRLCVEDGACRMDAGETEANCSVDCVGASVQRPVQQNMAQQVRPQAQVTPSSVPPRAGVLPVEVEAERPTTLLLSVMFFVLGLISFIFWIYLRKRSRA
jgi:hypothetical protein